MSMQKYWIIGFFILAVIGVGALFFVQGSMTTSSNEIDIGRYCSLSGTMTDIMPIQSHRSYCVKSLTDFNAFEVGQPEVYSFQIVDDQGSVVKDFAITHTKPMHLIVVREDLHHFQHLHPDFDKDTGTFTVADLTFSEPGPYRLFADFAVEGGMTDPSGSLLGISIADLVSIGKGYKPQPVGSEERTKTFGELEVTLETNNPLEAMEESPLKFILKDNGRSVKDLEEYLGALGHSVIFQEGSASFIHVHPEHDADDKQDGSVEFMTMFPSPGKYKIYTQFQRDGEVITTDFVVSVDGGTDEQGMEDIHGMSSH